MAKTKLLGDIDTALTAAQKFLIVIRMQAKDGYVSDMTLKMFKQKVDEVGTAIAALDKHIEKWNSPSLASKLKNLKKDQAKLKKSRDDAKADLGEFVKSFESLKTSLDGATAINKMASASATSQG
jgi:predicted  nucleic acid-binding Zn-ribbon protein